MRAVRRRRNRAQSLTELALVAPILIVLLIGAAQFGVLLYGSVAVDTAGRDGARVAAERPNGSGAYNNGLPVAGGAVLPADCSPVLDTSSNPVCAEVANSAGVKSSQPGSGLPMSVTAIIAGSAPPGSVSEPCPVAGGVQDGTISITVSYQAPVFIPILGGLIADPGKSYKTITKTITTRVEPCPITRTGT